MLRLIFFSLGVGLVFGGYSDNLMTRSTSARGRFLCGQDPARGVHVRLYRNNATEDDEEILGYTRTNEHGEFSLEGSTHGFDGRKSQIHPVLRVYHDCLPDEEMQGQGLRKFTYHINRTYVTLGRVPRMKYDLGTFNLEIIVPAEGREPRFQQVFPKNMEQQKGSHLDKYNIDYNGPPKSKHDMGGSDAQSHRGSVGGGSTGGGSNHDYEQPINRKDSIGGELDRSGSISGDSRPGSRGSQRGRGSSFDRGSGNTWGSYGGGDGSEYDTGRQSSGRGSIGGDSVGTIGKELYGGGSRKDSGEYDTIPSRAGSRKNSEISVP